MALGILGKANAWRAFCCTTSSEGQENDLKFKVILDKLEALDARLSSLSKGDHAVIREVKAAQQDQENHQEELEEEDQAARDGEKTPSPGEEFFESFHCWFDVWYSPSTTRQTFRLFASSNLRFRQAAHD